MLDRTPVFGLPIERIQRRRTKIDQVRDLALQGLTPGEIAERLPKVSVGTIGGTISKLREDGVIRPYTRRRGRGEHEFSVRVSTEVYTLLHMAARRRNVRIGHVVGLLIDAGSDIIEAILDDAPVKRETGGSAP